jgi:hypothetical protein
VAIFSRLIAAVGCLVSPPLHNKARDLFSTKPPKEIARILIIRFLLRGSEESALGGQRLINHTYMTHICIIADFENVCRNKFGHNSFYTDLFFTA